MLLFFTLAKKKTKTSGLAVFGNCSETSFNSFSYVRKTEDSESVGSASCNSIDHLLWSKLLNKNCAVSYWYIKQNLSWVWTSCSKGIFFVRKYWCFCHISKHFTFLNLKIWILVIFKAALASQMRPSCPCKPLSFQRSIFQTFWKVHCVTRYWFLELEDPNFGYLLIFLLCSAVQSFSKIRHFIRVPTLMFYDFLIYQIFKGGTLIKCLI